jgi:hypothetical protein
MRDFVGHEDNCFGLAPKTRFSQPKDQLAAKAPKHHFFWLWKYLFSDEPPKHDSASRKTNWRPKHRNINNEMFFDRGNTCFRTRPQNTIQPAERQPGRQSTETTIMTSFLVVGKAVSAPAPKTPFSQPKDQLAAKAPKHR